MLICKNTEAVDLHGQRKFGTPGLDILISCQNKVTFVQEDLTLKI